MLECQTVQTIRCHVLQLLIWDILSPVCPNLKIDILQYHQYMYIFLDKKSNQPWRDHESLKVWHLIVIKTVSFNPCPAEPGYTLFCKQCRSRSVGFWRSQLIWICTVCHSECEFISTICIKEFDWLKICKGRGILKYSAGQGLRIKSVGFCDPDWFYLDRIYPKYSDRQAWYNSVDSDLGSDY